MSKQPGQPSVKSDQTWRLSERRVTEHRHHISDFPHRELRLKAAVQVSETGVYDFDLATKTSYWSPELKAMAGLPDDAGELTPEHRTAIAHPEDRERFIQDVEAAVDPQGDGHIEGEYRIVRPGGDLRWVRVRGQTFFAGEAHERRALGASGVVIDITKEKEAENRLRESEERFRVLAGNVAQLVWMADEKGSIFWYNRRWYDYTGTTQEEVEGWGWQKVHHPEHVERVVSKIRHCFETGESWEDTFPLRSKDGEYRWFLSRAIPQRDASGRLFCWFGTNTDVTERKLAEEALRASEEKYRTLFANMTEGFLVGEPILDSAGNAVDHRFLVANQAFYVQTSLPGSIEGRRMRECFPLGEQHWIDRAAAVARTGQPNRFDFYNADTRRHYDIHAFSPSPGRFAILRRDITEQKQVELALRQSEEKFRATFEHAPLGIAECTVDGRFIDANAKLLEMLGYTKDEIAHLTIRDITHPSELEESLANLQHLAAGKIDSYVLEKRYIRKDRSFVWVNVTTSLAPIYGKPQYMVVTVEDITARKKVAEELKQAMESSYHQATHDTLTGLANRPSFTDRLNEALAYAKRDGHLVAIHLLDLDRFKSINDTLGHHIGDLLLKDVAKRIMSNVRASDLAARLGGDEFAVIQTHLTEEAAAGILAERLVESLGCKYVLEKQEVQSGTSIGIAVFPHDAENPEELIKRADLALYEAKHRGRFNYQFYRKELGAASLEAQRVKQELMHALRRNEFYLHYQPQFDLKNGRIVGIEALVRWQHPTRGRLTAAEFLRDAEHAKLIQPLGEWTLQTACWQHKAWVDAGLSVPLTLNLSAAQLNDPGLLETLKRILAETALPASMLQLEMRENGLWDPQLSKSLLHEMKACGLRLALDNFGAEMTSLHSLVKFPLDAVKPGHRLVQRLPSNSREAVFLAAIIGVAHHLNIAVCADGVETNDQFAAVKEQGCDSAQGYWLSLPLDVNQMTQLIDAELMH